MIDVLLFAAHPDDVDFGMGGTYLKLCDKYKVVQVILTHGEAGTHGTPAERESEAKAAAEYAGSTMRFLDFKDNHIEVNVANAKRIAAIIREYGPKVVFAPYHTIEGSHNDGEAHPDHTALGKLVLMACRFARFKNAEVEGQAHRVARIVYFMLPAFRRPSFMVDVSDTIPRLKELWQRYPTQLRILDGKVSDLLLLERRWLGTQHGVEYAEGFIEDQSFLVDVEDIMQMR